MDIVQIIEGVTPLVTNALTNITAALAAEPIGTILLVSLILATGYAIKAWKGGGK